MLSDDTQKQALYALLQWLLCKKIFKLLFKINSHKDFL